MFARSFPGRAAPALLIALAVWPAAAQAAPFTSPATLPGVPANSTLTGSYTDPAGRTTLVGTLPDGNLRQAFVTFVSAQGAPGSATPLGPAGAFTTQPRVAGAWNGSAAVTFAVGKTAFLSLCSSGRCARAQTVARTSLSPQPAVATNPTSGRTTVLWRGRTSSGASRLQWRITTNGRLGPAHTLGEFGDDPQIASDPSGKVVAVWKAHPTRSGGPKGLRTAARRVGEFTRPSTIQAATPFTPQLVTTATGETLAAWLSGPNFDVQSPSAQAWVARRTSGSSFGAPVPVGPANAATVTLAASLGGSAALALQLPSDAPNSVVGVSLRAPGGQFGTPQLVSAPAFSSTAFPPTATVDGGGEAAVAWSSETAPPSVVAGLFATRTTAPGTFAGAQPQTLSSAPGPTTNLQAPVLSAGPQPVVAWVDSAGGHVSVSSGG